MCGEILFTVLLIFVVKYTFMSNLWDQEYLDIILKDWDEGPITDLVPVSQMEGGEIDYWATECPSGYEVVSKGYWHGFKMGCVCPGGGYAEVDRRDCRDVMVRNGCSEVDEMAFTELPTVGGVRYCAKRDTSYNFLTVLKPTNNTATGSYECKDPKMSKMCGGNVNKYEHVFCIPASSVCPITKIKFDLNNATNLILSRDVVRGTPLIGLDMSEGGPPCMHSNEYHNNQVSPPKIPYLLFKDAYYDACPQRVINGKTYNTSTLYRPVNGFKPVSEWRMIYENLDGAILKTIKRFPRFDDTQLDKYMMNMYSKQYLKWNHNTC